MPALPHRIRRQRWHVRTRSSDDAFSLRQKLRQELEGALLPALERAFDEAAPGDAVVHVPRLEVRLRIPSAESLVERLPELLYQEVREQLGEVLRDGGGGSTVVGPGGGVASLGRGSRAFTVRGGMTPGVGARGREAARAAGEQGRRQLRAHYLETGSLPWALVGLDRTQLLDWLRPGVAEALQDVRARPVPRAGLGAGEVAFYFRLLQLLPVEQWAAVAMEVAVGDWGGEAARVLAALAGEGAAPLSRDARLQLAAVLLAACRVGPEVATCEELVPLLVRAVGEGRGRTAEALTSELPETPGAFFRRWLRPSEGSWPAAVDAPASGQGRSGRPGPLLEEPRAGLEAEALREAQAARAAARPVVPGTGSEPFLLPVSHAGLLLLHPYLSRFFESTGIKEPKRAELPVERLPRAAALLHLLAVGEAEVHELELDFIKLLLGLPHDAHLPIASGLLQPADDEEATALLQAVIEHWKALKNTSVQGLRVSFLQRRGFVREQEQGLLLQVEPAAFDVLLGAIPWGIGTVKLPWMKKPIFTEWPTP